MMGRATATAANPGYVYELVINNPVPNGMSIIDPLLEVGKANPTALAAQSYHHDGDPNFLLGVVDPVNMTHYLLGFAPTPPGSGATARPPILSNDLEALVRILRDAEVLVSGNIPGACFTVRHPVF